MLTRNKRNRVESLLVKSVLATVLLFFLFPVFWLLYTSLKPELLTFAWPPIGLYPLTFDNYFAVFREIEGFAGFLANSVVIAASSTLMAILIGTPAAYSFARFDIKGKRNILFWILSTRMFPPVAAIIPTFLVWTNLGLVDTHLGLALVYALFNLPLVVWVLRGFFLQIPRELDEAALIDGCSIIQALMRIVFPVVAPAVVSIAILCVVFSWNEFAFALILTRYSARTLPVALAGFIEPYRIRWALMSAAGFTTVLPVLAFALLVQKYIIRGLTLGAIK